ncbi:MAG TPA: TetR/AcrR family transcriptional regulator [Terriglobales bacterium]|nr:TetR/AcrR family transcriptional regulator [Terriglobales bacterium]
MRAGRESSRERLQLAARRLYAEVGFEATTTAAIARAAGTSQSQFVKHFGDKQGVLAAILEGAWGELLSAVRLATERVEAPQDRFRLALDMLLSYLAREREFRAIWLREGLHLARRAGGTTYAEFLALLDEIFREMLLAGELLPHVNTRALRSGVMGAMANMLYYSDVVAETGAALPFSEDEVRHTVLSFLAGSKVQAERTPAMAEPAEPPWVTRYMELAEKVLGPGGRA